MLLAYLAQKLSVVQWGEPPPVQAGVGAGEREGVKPAHLLTEDLSEPNTGEQCKDVW